MRRSFATGLILAALAVGCAPEDRTCRRMSDLCGTEAAECRASVAELRKAGGEEAVKELEQCYAKAETCAAANGCEAALQAKSAVSAVGDFFESLSEGLAEDAEST
jgi:hypothetical protein